MNANTAIADAFFAAAAMSGTTVDALIAAAQAAAPKKPAAKKPATKKPVASKTSPKSKAGAKNATTPKKGKGAPAQTEDITAPILADVPHAELAKMAESEDLLSVAFDCYTNESRFILGGIEFELVVEYDFGIVKSRRLEALEGDFKGAFIYLGDINRPLSVWKAAMSSELLSRAAAIHRHLRAVAAKEDPSYGELVSGQAACDALVRSRVGRYILGELGDRAVIELRESRDGPWVKLVFYQGKNTQMANIRTNAGKPFGVSFGELRSGRCNGDQHHKAFVSWAYDKVVNG